MRLSKTSPRIRAIGAVDELNCLMGSCRTHAQASKRRELAKQLELIQQELFDLGAYLATPKGGGPSDLCPAPAAEWVTRLETWIDALTRKLPPLGSFVLPGGTSLNCALHGARAVCRRAEHEVVELHLIEPLEPTSLQYLNRLSDFLFTCTREESRVSKRKELLWVPAEKRAKKR